MTEPEENHAAWMLRVVGDHLADGVVWTQRSLDRLEDENGGSPAIEYYRGMRDAYKDVEALLILLLNAHKRP